MLLRDVVPPLSAAPYVDTAAVDAARSTYARYDVIGHTAGAARMLVRVEAMEAGRPASWQSAMFVSPSVFSEGSQPASPRTDAYKKPPTHREPVRWLTAPSCLNAMMVCEPLPLWARVEHRRR